MHSGSNWLTYVFHPDKYQKFKIHHCKIFDIFFILIKLKYVIFWPEVKLRRNRTYETFFFSLYLKM